MRKPSHRKEKAVPPRWDGFRSNEVFYYLCQSLVDELVRFETLGFNMTIIYKRIGNYLRVLSIILLLGVQISMVANAAPRKKRGRKISRPTVLDSTAKTDEAKSSTTEVIQTEDTELTTLINKLISKGEKLLGKPYRASGIAPWVLDCSGYVCYLYNQLGINIPRTSAALSTYTERVAEPKAGDLIFFKGRNASAKRVGHVALVVDNNNGDPIIMHSTNSRGIIKHRLSQVAYFSKRYLFAGRLPEIAEMLKTDDSCDNNI